MKKNCFNIQVERERVRNVGIKHPKNGLEREDVFMENIDLAEESDLQILSLVNYQKSANKYDNAIDNIIIDDIGQFNNDADQMIGKLKKVNDKNVDQFKAKGTATELDLDE